MEQSKSCQWHIFYFLLTVPNCKRPHFIETQHHSQTVHLRVIMQNDCLKSEFTAHSGVKNSVSITQETLSTVSELSSDFRHNHIMSRTSSAIISKLLFALTLTLLMASCACCMRALFVGVLSDSRWVQPK